MNANLNTYYEKKSRDYNYDSNYIRKTYLSNARRSALAEAIDTAWIWYMVFTLKIVGGTVCAISFFSVLGMIESGKLSPIAGILCTILITALECLCFVPIGKKPKKLNFRRR